MEVRGISLALACGSMLPVPVRVSEDQILALRLPPFFCSHHHMLRLSLVLLPLDLL